jgi:hypothetical protein
MTDWNSLFRYEPETGLLFWKVNISNKKAGNIAGSINNHGYCVIRYKYRCYMAHRIIWEMCTGPVPDNVPIDHRDRNRSNNRIKNLRIATQSQNNMNSSLRDDSTSGYKGVRWHKQRQKWCSQICVNKKSIHLGFFDCIREAAEHYEAARNKYFGEFA